jgi:hypothetical protein
VEIREADLDAGVLAGATHLALHLDLGAVVGLLDPRRVDAAVGDELLEREPPDLAAHRVEAGEQDRLGRVVDDEVDAGHRLEGADVAALATDDAALHVVRRQRKDRHGRLGGLLRGDPLDGQGHDLAAAPLRLLARLLLEVPDQPHRVPLGLLLDLPDQHGLGLTGGHGRDLLEPAPLLLDHLVQLAAVPLRRPLAVVQVLLTAVQCGELALEGLLPREQALLTALHLRKAAPDVTFDLRSKLH